LKLLPNFILCLHPAAAAIRLPHDLPPGKRGSLLTVALARLFADLPARHVIGYLWPAEGYTGSGFGEYLTIEDPDPTNTAAVVVTFLPSNGSAQTVQTYSIAPGSRFTLFTNGVLSNQSFSMVVESNVAIVAERPMYFVFNGSQTGGSDVIGYQP
jgi:hypothetical protein